MRLLPQFASLRVKLFLAAIEAVLARVRSDDGIPYLVLSDANGIVVARTGWDAACARSRSPNESKTSRRSTC